MPEAAGSQSAGAVKSQMERVVFGEKTADQFRKHCQPGVLPWRIFSRWHTLPFHPTLVIVTDKIGKSAIARVANRIRYHSRAF